MSHSGKLRYFPTQVIFSQLWPFRIWTLPTLHLLRFVKLWQNKHREHLKAFQIYIDEKQACSKNKLFGMIY